MDNLTINETDNENKSEKKIEINTINEAIELTNQLRRIMNILNETYRRNLEPSHELLKKKMNIREALKKAIFPLLNDLSEVKLLSVYLESPESKFLKRKYSLIYVYINSFIIDPYTKNLTAYLADDSYIEARAYISGTNIPNVVKGLDFEVFTHELYNRERKKNELNYTKWCEKRHDELVNRYEEYKKYE